MSLAERHGQRSLVRLYRELGTAVNRDVRAHSTLSGADFEILDALTETSDGRLPFQDLARAVGWGQSRLPRQISRMPQRGLVAREECAEAAEFQQRRYVTLPRDRPRPISRCAAFPG
ncbi:winged helix-turn-helix domain-containing protein [Streptomyces sp. NPDC091215]|uniref:winged helix-turn-helix domain-containing protein n=1 Tax=Streptomyces sp. NPDC091215 TaxID=3155192 RepID=UPI0034398B91